MKIVVAAFYADIIDQPSRLHEFLPFIRASSFALNITNPSAEYLVLTDYATSKLLERYKIDCVAIAPEHMSLMSKIIFAQKEFVKRCDADLIILPDVDCISNRDLTYSTKESAGFATTHRGAKFGYRINNLAYIRDRDLGYWFLERAYNILQDWPIRKRLWEGDQEAWQAALSPSDEVYNLYPIDPPYSSTSLYDFEDIGDDILITRPDGRNIYLYPCTTHNCFINDAGIIKDNHRNAYMVHFKGTRKQHLGKWIKERFGDEYQN